MATYTSTEHLQESICSGDVLWMEVPYGHNRFFIPVTVYRKLIDGCEVVPIAGDGSAIIVRHSELFRRRLG